MTSWLRPLSTPLRAAAVIASVAFFAAPFVEGSVSQWLQPLSQPVRARPSPASQSFFIDPNALTLKESVSVDRWLQPLSQPQSRQRALPSLDAFFWSTFTPASGVETITLDKWYQPLSIPGLGRPQPRAESVFWPAPIFGEIITIDKWYQPFSRVLPARRSPAADGIFWAQSVVPEIVTVDKWYQPFAPPMPGRRSPMAGGVFWAQPVTTEVITLDKWFEPLAQPSARRMQYPPRPEFFGPTFVPSPPMGTWFAALSQPGVRARPGLPLAQAFVIDPAALLLPPHQPSGSADPLEWLRPLARVRLMAPRLVRQLKPAALVRLIEPEQRIRSIKPEARIRMITAQRGVVKKFSPTTPGGRPDCSVDFSSILAGAYSPPVTVNTCIVTCAIHPQSAVPDAGAASRCDGAAIITAGKLVTQFFKNGVAGASYILTYAAVLSNGATEPIDAVIEVNAYNDVGT